MTAEQFLWAVPLTIIAIGLAAKLALYVQRKRGTGGEAGPGRG